MVFIRKKRDYFYLVKSRKEGSKVMQDISCYLGKKEDVIKIFETFKERWMK